MSELSLNPALAGLFPDALHLSVTNFHVPKNNKDHVQILLTAEKQLAFDWISQSET